MRGREISRREDEGAEENKDGSALHRNHPRTTFFWLFFQHFFKNRAENTLVGFPSGSNRGKLRLMQTQGHSQEDRAARNFVFMRRSRCALSLGPSKRISPERGRCTLLHPIALCVFEPHLHPVLHFPNQVSAQGGRGDPQINEQRLNEERNAGGSCPNSNRRFLLAHPRFGIEASDETNFLNSSITACVSEFLCQVAWRIGQNGLC